MKNFYSFNPVKVLFGNGLLDNIERELDDVERILIVHSGRSSINTNALPKTKEALSRKKIFEFTKFSENPDISDGINAIKYGREKEIEFILCIGGGSCIDFGKLICLGMYADEKNLWEILKKEHNAPNKTLPFGTVLTLPASGSEVNNALVISNKKTKEKISTFFLTLYPRFSVLDPSFTINLNKEQTALGILDMFMHTIEQYLTFPVNTPLQDR